MLYDLHYWGLGWVAGWQVEDLPGDVLLSYWAEMQVRKAKEINAYSQSSAYLVAFKEAQRKESTKLDMAKWLPYKLSATDDKGSGQKSSQRRQIVVSAEVKDLLLAIRDRYEMPPQMEKDLYRANIISPGD